MDYYKLKILNNKKIIIGVLLVFILIGSFLIYYFFYYDKKDILVVNNELDNVNNDNEINNLSHEIYVDIKGYVSKPGVYCFNDNDNARVNDLILKAGGLKKDADTSLINLSQKLEDEMTIVIYSKKEVSDYVNIKNDLKEKLELCELKIKNNACIKENIKSDNNLVNINEATKEELMSLSGIGEAKAEAIIKYRTTNKFKKINDLLNVEGIGNSLFESIKDNIKV